MICQALSLVPHDPCIGAAMNAAAETILKLAEAGLSLPVWCTSIAHTLAMALGLGYKPST